MKSLGRTSRLILTVLASEPSHGYGVISWVRDVSGGAETLGVGAVYGSIEKLEQKGLIEHDRDEVERGRARRYFRITDGGRSALALEVSSLAREVAEAQKALSAASGSGVPGLVSDL